MENFAYLHLFLVKYILLVSQSFGFTSSSKCSDFSFFFGLSGKRFKFFPALLDTVLPIEATGSQTGADRAMRLN